MKYTQTLFEKAEDLWKEAAENPFVTEMAEGTLEIDRFRNYMLQDYLYLLDYIDILKCMLKYTDDPFLGDFLLDVIQETERETNRVHLPNMKKAGITQEQIKNCSLVPEAAEYLQYMRNLLPQEGLLAGLTALLQCSWAYAYIGQNVSAKYREELSRSPYKSWFDAYTCPEYIEANQKWIDLLDKETADIPSNLAEKLRLIFRKCAEYENRFWDVM